ncbi:hypothetical protein PTTG_25945 [Puccinia triticina 1-1 BBBD Race 1]|uniref:Uncharacterized protein n=2 Tax=Puccinia triticina TaxID=208348 RepID=A0A180H091_PUCT1|nr:hypothetical protein PTTG_25945 [Puccinia triticina 1-1 BBBD Race 1]
MSDCSHLLASSVSEADGPPAGLPLLIVDTMRLTHHISHFGIADAVETAAKLRAHRTYILGFTHGVTHKCWQAACELISKTSNTGLQATLDPSPTFPEDIDLGNNPPRFSQQALALCQDHIREAPLWIRPAFDGLVISTDGVKITDNFHP